jgi:mRNA-degrading endonuclease RelE of RelBE toxin-antitoxin system
MNRVLIPFSVEKTIDDLPERVRKQLFAKLHQLQEDPIADSVRVPFKEFDDVRMVQLGDYVLLFRLDAQKSELYPLALSKV